MSFYNLTITPGYHGSFCFVAYNLQFIPSIARLYGLFEERVEKRTQILNQNKLENYSIKAFYWDDYVDLK